MAEQWSLRNTNMRNTQGMKPSAKYRTLRWQLPIILVLALLLGLSMPAAAQESTPAATPEATPESPTYVVQPGDTLFQIAERFDTTVEAIVAANDIDNPRLITWDRSWSSPQRGQSWSPHHGETQTGACILFVAGETLPFLAFRYGTTIWALREANDLGWFSLLAPGQELDIPSPIAPHAGVPNFPRISSWFPDPMVQGQTMLVEIQGEGELEIEAAVLGQDYDLVEGEGGTGRWWVWMRSRRRGSIPWW